MILLTVEEARAFEARVRERLSATEGTLIERAGSAAAELAAGRLAGLDKKRVVVLCGKGNNAADGLMMARHARAMGAEVAAVLAFGEQGLAPEAAAALHGARGAGVRTLPADKALEAAQGADLVVDALVGTGARLPLSGVLGALAAMPAVCGAPVLALDLPSGLDADTGEVRGPCVTATWTLTFLAGKLGLALGDGPARCGELTLAGLGADQAWAGASAFTFDAGLALRSFGPRPKDSHKKKAELLVVAGSKEYLGAALMCARGAYRCGAGLVRVALPEALAPFAQAALPEAVVAGLPADGALGEMHLEAILGLAASAKAAVVGPGLGRRDETLSLARELWGRLPMPAVFDADALAALRPGTAPGGERILTPHEGELRTLMGPGALDRGRVAAARKLALTASCVALLKGPSTLVARPDGVLSVDLDGTEVLATAGTGDVLSGAIGALLAQGLDAFTAAGLGACIHGRSGAAWARAHGTGGLLASELADGLPDALAGARRG